jgi:hypothetical protein
MQRHNLTAEGHGHLTRQHPSDAEASTVLTPNARIGLIWRQNPSAGTEQSRVQPILHALTGLGVDAFPLLYSEETEGDVREQLLQLDGALVWVDPLSYGRDRSRLDELLRNVSTRGVWVSANPDVILKMGTKEVLFTTRHLGWGTATDEYESEQEFRERFPIHLAAGPRVLKQYRGNGGQGVWKVELLEAGLDRAGPGAPVRVLEARRNSLEEDVPLGAFMDRCKGYFAGAGRLLDQPFQQRLSEGMIRCYLCLDSVIGFTHQLIRGLMPARPAAISRRYRNPDPGSCSHRLRQVSIGCERKWSWTGFRICAERLTSNVHPYRCSGTPIFFSDRNRRPAKIPTCCARST